MSQEDPEEQVPQESSEGTPPPAEEEGTSSEGEAASQEQPPTRRLNNRLAQNGRKLKSAEAEVEELRNQVAALAERERQREAAEAERQRMDEEAALAALPPDQQALARVERLQNQLTEAERRQQRREYAERRMQELVDAANEAYGFDGDIAITKDTPGLDRRSEEAYIASIRAIAAERQSRQGGNVATKGKEESTEEVVKRVVQDTLKGVGLEAGRPISAKPNGSGQPGIAREDVHELSYSKTSRAGTRGKLAELKTAREKAAAALK